jgi:16S rRNA processing protein RimM
VSKTPNKILKMLQGKPVTIGRITKSRGLRGELWVEPFTDDISRFKKLKSVILEKTDGSFLQVELEEAKIQKGSVVLKILGVDDRTSADSLCNSYITVNSEELEELEEGSYYIFELQGIDVFDQSEVPIGKVIRVEEYPSNAVLVIASDTEEILLPAVKEFIVSVDTGNRRLTVRLPEGLPVYPIKANI